MIMSIAATAQSTCSSFSTPTDPGAASRLPTSGQLATLLSACASWSTSTIRKPSRSGSCWTIYRRILPARSMKPSRHPRRTAYCAAWSSTTPQSMPAGSTWSRSRSACCAASASTAASARATASSPKLPPGNSNATPPAPASPGCSPPSALAPKWPALTPTLPKCHNPCAEVLGGAEHWTAAVARPGVFTRNTDAASRRRERIKQVAAANRILHHYGMTLVDWQGSAFVLSTATGKTEIVDNLVHLWTAAERLLGRPCDPLDAELIALMERELA